MPVLPQFNTRSGEKQILKLAQTLCRVVSVSEPVIRAKFPDRTALLAVLDAALAFCALLPAAQAEQAAADAMDPADFDPADGTPFPGQIP